MRRASHRKARPRPDDGAPTPERRNHAHSGIAVGGERGDAKIFRILSPLERLALNGKLERFRCEALHRLWESWREGQLHGNLKSPALDRVAVTANTGFTPIGDLTMAHRRRFQAAWNRLEQVERDVVGLVVLQEATLKAAGAALGFRSPCRGREAVLGLLRSAADRLVRG